MKRTPIVLRERADRDVGQALAYYRDAGSRGAAAGVIDALEAVFSHLGRYPAAGSTRLAVELNLPGLRVWPVRGYPNVICYFDRAMHIDVWRVLHGERDVPATLRDPV